MGEGLLCTLRLLTVMMQIHSGAGRRIGLSLHSKPQPVKLEVLVGRNTQEADCKGLEFKKQELSPQKSGTGV